MGQTARGVMTRADAMMRVADRIPVTSGNLMNNLAGLAAELFGHGRVYSRSGE